MHTLRLVFLTVGLTVLLPSVSSAQISKIWGWWPNGESNSSLTCGQGEEISEACRRNFEEWLEEELKWRRVHSIWANHVIYRGLRTPIVGRRGVKRPEIPWWMASHCAPEIEQNLSPKSKVCSEYETALNYDWVMYVRGPESNITYASRVSVSSGEENKIIEYLLKNLHVDGVWTNSSNGSRAWGLLGNHLTFAHTGRLYFWGPPGFIIFRHPEGKLEIKMTYGIDVYLTNVPLPFTEHKLPMYVTFAKAFDRREMKALLNNMNVGIDMVGFSITLK